MHGHSTISGSPVTTDYSAEPPTYPDGHTCNALCRPQEGEHFAVAYAGLPYPPAVAADFFRERLAAHGSLRQLIRIALAPESPPSVALPEAYFVTAAPLYSPQNETAYRYWFTYPAHVEDAVRQGGLHDSGPDPHARGYRRADRPGGWRGHSGAARRPPPHRANRCRQTEWRGVRTADEEDMPMIKALLVAMLLVLFMYGAVVVLGALHGAWRNGITEPGDE